MTQVAKKAGVSQQVVSKVIHKKYDVNEKTRERVLKIIEELNYQPNYLASSLRSGKRMCIGTAVTGNMEDMVTLAPSAYCAGIGSVMEQHGYNMELIPRRGDFHNKVVEIMRRRTVDGLIIVVYSDIYKKFIEETQPLLNKEKFPYVVIHETDRALECHSVGIDTRRTGYLATRHMLTTGRTRVRMVLNTAIHSHTDAYQGYEMALTEQGLGAADPIIPESKDPGAGYIAGKQAADQGPEHGYIVFSEAVASGFLRGLREKGIHVPEETAVIACENGLSERAFYTPLTVMDRKFLERGRIAAEYLLRIMTDKPKPGSYLTHVAQPELILRETA
jgi:DNA-binding LacI/PurR family transcriptional regulator